MPNFRTNYRMICQAGLAQYDESTSPKQTIIDGQQAFTFQYSNGEGL